MDVNKILEELRQEREQIDDAILALERLAVTKGKRRGRPPQWMKEAEERKATGRARKAASGNR